jgi:hypothetical protein
MRIALAWTLVLLIAGCGSSGSGRSFSATVLNDRKREVEVQPCGPAYCTKFKPVVLAPGAAHTWHTIDSGAGITSFGVFVPDNRSLGCLAQHGLYRGQPSVTVRVSSLEECET